MVNRNDVAGNVTRTLSVREIVVWNESGTGN